MVETLKTSGHVYCDGGMCNDFPVNALPADVKRMGLMVRPIDWIRHHLPGQRIQVDGQAKVLGWTAVAVLLHRKLHCNLQLQHCWN